MKSPWPIKYAIWFLREWLNNIVPLTTPGTLITKQFVEYRTCSMDSIHLILDSCVDSLGVRSKLPSAFSASNLSDPVILLAILVRPPFTLHFSSLGGQAAGSAQYVSMVLSKNRREKELRCSF